MFKISRALVFGTAVIVSGAGSMAVLWPTPCAAQTTRTASAGQSLAGANASDDAQPPDSDASASPSPQVANAAPPASGGGSGKLSSISSHAESFSRNGPFRDGWLTIDLNSRYAKAVIGGFKEGAILGMGLQVTTADLIPFVEFRATAITSPRLYRRFEGEAYVPKIFDNKTHADIWFDYLYRDKDDFFGIGPNTPKTSKTDFGIEQRSYNASLFHDFARGLQIGVYGRFANTGSFPGQNSLDIPSNLVFSGNPQVVPITLFSPGLLEHSKILSYGGFALLDRRDNSEGLTKGMYLYGRLGAAQGYNDGPAFADYGWLEAEMDARGYVPLGSDRTSLAVRGYADLNRPRGGSQIPFYEMPFMGGRMDLRGFENYRFRGNNVALFSAELRQTVWAQREDRGLDVIVFGDAGQVWGDNRSMLVPAIVANQDFSSRNWKASIGGGIQYRLSSAFAGRIEVGHSNERNIIYLSLSRGF